MKRIFIMDDDGLKEYVPLESMIKATEVIVKIAEKVAVKFK